MTNDLTTMDIKILDHVQKDSSLSTAELADKVGLSQSPCWRRLQRLKDEGYIKREVAILDRSKFGLDLYIFALIKMETIGDEQRAEFIRKVEATPEIVECHTTFGEHDVMFKVIAPSLVWYQNFIFNVIYKLPGVRDIQSTVTLMEVKNVTTIPVRGARAM